MNEQQDIIKKLAAMQPGAPSEVDGDSSCFFCSAYLQGNVPHEPDCIWMQANRVVNRQKDPKVRLAELVVELRQRAAPVGPMHAFWDMIFDIEAVLANRDAVVKMTIEQRIAEAEEALGL